MFDHVSPCFTTTTLTTLTQLHQVMAGDPTEEERPPQLTAEHLGHVLSAFGTSVGLLRFTDVYCR